MCRGQVWRMKVSSDYMHMARVNVLSDSTSVDSFPSPSNSQGVGVLWSHCVIQHSVSIFSNGSRVSGPGHSGSRATSRDTGESELKTAAINIRVDSEQHGIRDRYTTWKQYNNT